MKSRSLLLPALPFLLTGCKVSGEGPAVDLVNMLLETELHTLLGLSIVWTLIGVVVGGVGGLALFFVLRRMGGYRWEWPHAKWLRLLVAITLVVGGVVAGGGAGMIEGAERGFERVLRKSQLATKVFPVAGDMGADMTVVFYLQAPELEAGKRFVYPTEQLEAFRRGEWEVDVAKLQDLSHIDDETLERVVEQLESEHLDKVPSWRGGVFEGVLHYLDMALARALVGQSGLANTQLGYRKLAAAMREGVAALPEAAKKVGDPNTIARKELSEHMVQYGVVPTIMIPAGALAGIYQRLFLYGFMALMLLPVPLFRIAEWIRKRRAAAAAALVSEPVVPASSDAEPTTPAPGEAGAQEGPASADEA